MASLAAVKRREIALFAWPPAYIGATHRAPPAVASKAHLYMVIAAGGWEQRLTANGAKFALKRVMWQVNRRWPPELKSHFQDF